MGRTRGRYNAEFVEGSRVRIADRSTLESFQRDWHWHNPLQSAQIDFAGTIATVKSVGYYHGGDELYELDGISGVWHEECLTSADSDSDSDRTRS
jgi:hypothetical protein